jgi:hypothetical protein
MLRFPDANLHDQKKATQDGLRAFDRNNYPSSRSADHAWRLACPNPPSCVAVLRE